MASLNHNELTTGCQKMLNVCQSTAHFSMLPLVLNHDNNNWYWQIWHQRICYCQQKAKKPMAWVTCYDNNDSWHWLGSSYWHIDGLVQERRNPLMYYMNFHNLTEPMLTKVCRDPSQNNFTENVLVMQNLPRFKCVHCRLVIPCSNTDLCHHWFR